MLEFLKRKEKTISVTGLGYVGLPLALAFSKKFQVIAFDIREDRIQLMKNKQDPSKELESDHFDNSNILFTSDANKLKNAHFHIIAVPTDIDEAKVPNLRPLLIASESVGKALKKGDYVIYESTVYPGCTEEECLPILERSSSLKLGRDFKLGYSPERIVPGDKNRPLTKILKIVAGSDKEAASEIEDIYNEIIEAGIYQASSIKVAEAAKVIENTQRDLNISLMNELAIIFDKIGIDTHEVIEAAATKWNFHKYYPGLVGGHCISVDPFYLMHKAKEVGLEPQVIAAGRRVNDFIPQFIAKSLVQKLIEIGKNPGDAKVLVLGITFKENVSDIRNSKVVDLVEELTSYSLSVDISDLYASGEEVRRAHNLELQKSPGGKYDALILAVNHREYIQLESEKIYELLQEPKIIFDIKKSRPDLDSEDVIYWCL